MADFCKQCSIDLFDEDFGEHKGLCKPGFLTTALCEGCGFINVNSEGECLTPDCLEKGKPGHGVEFTMPEECNCILYTLPNPDNNIGVQEVSATCPIHQGEPTPEKR